MGITRFIKRKLKHRRVVEIAPDEVFLDSENLPNFDVNQFEGRIEKPISVSSFVIFTSACVLLFVIILSKAWSLQISNGDGYFQKSENNRLEHDTIFAERGSITDRFGTKLAWNSPLEQDNLFGLRNYTGLHGFSHILGYVTYPKKDKNGNFFQTDIQGIQGIEKIFNKTLAGQNGLKITEMNALGKVESESVIRPAQNGENLQLSLDGRLQSKMYETILDLSNRIGFLGGAGGIMDIQTGEVISMVSVPEYDSAVMSLGIDRSKIQSFNKDARKPFLDRFVTGLYTPGSIVKPFMGLAALTEDIIDSSTNIISRGSISVPNPYDPTKKTVFNDWKAHGAVDMRRAIAVSSDVYFYEIGGGFEDQKGLGIERIAKYMNVFGFGLRNNDEFFGGPAGVVPTPEWKLKAFDGDPWRIGDTYFTSIGQYGFQVTPLQALRATASLANGHGLLDPTIFKQATSTTAFLHPFENPFSEKNLDIVRAGMRDAVLSGTASGLNVPYVEVAAKTGTAEIGVGKKYVNAWVVGFFPADHPRYAFTVMMERGPHDNTIGGVFVMRTMLDWMNQNTPEYFQ